MKTTCPHFCYYLLYIYYPNELSIYYSRIDGAVGLVE